MKTLITATESLDPPLGGAEMSLSELIRGVSRQGPTIGSSPNYEPLTESEESEEHCDPWKVVSYFSSSHGQMVGLTDIEGLEKVTKRLAVKGPLSFLGWRFRNPNSGSPNKLFFGLDLKMRNYRFEKWLSKQLREFSEEGRKVGLTQLKWSAGASEAFTKSGIPYVLFIRDQTHFEYPEMYRKSVENAEVVCAAGDGLIDDIGKVFNLKRAANIPLPIDFSSRFGDLDEVENAIISKLEKAELRDSPRPRIAIVGITPEKGLETYQKLIPKMLEDWPEAIFDVYGWRQKFLKNIISMPNVRFHGRVDAEEIFCNCDIHVLITETTGSWGRVISEAGVFQVPTVTNSIGSQPEAVGNGGIVVKNHKDLDEFSGALKICYSEREKLGIEARSHCKIVDHRRSVAIFREVLESI